jgi:hypothetical protein
MGRGLPLPTPDESRFAVFPKFECGFPTDLVIDYGCD